MVLNAIIYISFLGWSGFVGEVILGFIRGFLVFEFLRVFFVFFVKFYCFFCVSRVWEV